MQITKSTARFAACTFTGFATSTTFAPASFVNGSQSRDRIRNSSLSGM